MSWPRYEPATYNSKGAQPGAQALMNVFVQDYGAQNLGIYNWRTVRGPSQAISLHGEGRGVDLGYTNKAKGDAALALLLQHKEALGIQMVIWWRRIYSAKAPNGATYQGVVPHTDHLHVELTKNAGRSLTEARIRSVLRGGAPPPYVAPAAAKPTTPAAPPIDLAAIHRLVQEDTDMILICNGKGIAHVIDKDCWSAISVAELEQVRAAYKKAARSLPELTVSAARWNQYLS